MPAALETTIIVIGFILTGIGAIAQYAVSTFYVVLALSFTGTMGDFTDRLTIAAFAVLVGATLRYAAFQLTHLLTPIEDTP